jgi:hypothetical protein
MGVLDSIQRQFDDEPGGGVVDEAPTSTQLLASPTTAALYPAARFVEERAGLDATLGDVGSFYGDVADRDSGASNQVGEGVADVADGLRGSDSSGLSAIGAALRWALSNPLLVVGAAVLLYSLPLLTSVAGVAEGLVGD